MAFKSLHQILDHLENRYQPREQQQLQQAIRCWNDVVGPVVAAQAQPVAVQRNVLRVATSSSAWAQNLVFERQRILEKMNAVLSFTLTDIRFATAQWQSSPSLPADANEQAQLWQQHPSRLPGQTGPRSPGQLADAMTDPTAAFQHWAKMVRSRSHNLPLCPHCQCPTPPGELKRWDACALCAAKRW